MKVSIFVKKLGKNRTTAAPICYEYPEGVHSVRDLLKETVRLNLEAFQKGHQDTEIFRALSEEKIEVQAQTGKIGFGVHYNAKNQNFEKAVENAWQCFEDGIVVLFVDGEQKEGLEDPADLHENSELTFIRLTMLAGRMW